MPTRRFVLVGGWADSQEATKSGASTSGESTPALSASSTTDEDSDRVQDPQEDSDEADDKGESEESQAEAPQADRVQLLTARLEALDVGHQTGHESEGGNAGPATERAVRDKEVENSGIDTVTEDADLATDGSTGSANVSTTSTKH